jgi:hypothetical protein
MFGTRSARQPLVQEGVIGAQQVKHASVLSEHAADEQLRLALHRGAECFVEVGEQDLVGLLRRDVPQVQPLGREVGDQ